MKVGDKVRFLDATGGGIVSSISGNKCMVADEDGFEYPALISQCVVVSDEDDARAAGHAPVHQAPPSQSAMERVKLVSQSEDLKAENGRLKSRIHELENELQQLKLTLLRMQYPSDKDRKTILQPRKGETLRNDIIEVDLHIDALLDTTAGMDAASMLKYQLEVFRDTMKTYRHQLGQKIVFIHGKGEGVLRHSILEELRFRYPNCDVQDASFQQYGFGATQVTIHK